MSNLFLFPLWEGQNLKKDRKNQPKGRHYGGTLAPILGNEGWGNKTKKIALKHGNEIFSRHGYPETLVADNMPYNSREMRSYVQRCYVNRSFIRYIRFRYTDQILNMVKKQKTWHKIPLKGKPLILK